MLETLSRGFGAARDRLRGVTTLTDENVDEALRDVRTALLEADVDFQVAKDFLGRVKTRVLGERSRPACGTPAAGSCARRRASTSSPPARTSSSRSWARSTRSSAATRPA